MEVTPTAAAPTIAAALTLAAAPVARDFRVTTVLSISLT
jgi:hypothetical protein